MNTSRINHLARLTLATCLLTLAAGIVSLPAANAPTAATPPASTTAPRGTNAPPALKFRPMTMGSPSVRVTGGSRGTGDNTLLLDALVPDEVGLTTQEQPSLFWFQSKPSKAQLELTLLQPKNPKPLMRFHLKHADQAGIQRVRLADQGVKLKSGVEYQWVVALVNDPDNRSKDLVASGVIKRIDPSPELTSRLSKSNPSSNAGAYADSGIWYDSLTSISDEIAARPQDASLRKARADLLRQVGLKAASFTE